jgi:hypothetical protein
VSLKTLLRCAVVGGLVLPGSLFAQNGWTDLGQTPLWGAGVGVGIGYDKTRDRLVAAALGTYEYDGTTWSTVAPAPPTYGAMAYDESRQRTVLIESVLGRPTWEWDGASWRQATTSSPVSLIVYDSGRGSVVGFGLGQGGYWLYEWDGSNWNPIWTTNAPPYSSPAYPNTGIGYSALGYDPSRDRLCLFGTVFYAPCCFNPYPPIRDTWEWDATNGWVHLPNAGGPSASNIGMFFDDRRGKLTVLAPDSTTHSIVVFRFSGGSWHYVPGANGWPLGFLLQGAYDSLRGRMLVYDFSLGHLWSFDPARASYETVAPGCPGQLGTPGLVVSQWPSLPWIGGSFSLEITNVPSVCFLATTLAQLRTPVDLTAYGMPGCMQYIPRAHFLFLTASGGTAALQLSIPNNPYIIGQEIFQQALVLSPGSNAAGVVVSDLARAVIGQ